MQDAYLLPLSRNVLRSYGCEFHWLHMSCGYLARDSDLLRVSRLHSIIYDLILECYAEIACAVQYSTVPQKAKKIEICISTSDLLY